VRFIGLRSDVAHTARVKEDTAVLEILANLHAQLPTTVANIENVETVNFADRVAKRRAGEKQAPRLRRFLMLQIESHIRIATIVADIIVRPDKPVTLRVRQDRVAMLFDLVEGGEFPCRRHNSEDVCQVA